MGYANLLVVNEADPPSPALLPPTVAASDAKLALLLICAWIDSAKTMRQTNRGFCMEPKLGLRKQLLGILHLGR
jgi:hypothetical protein